MGWIRRNGRSERFERLVAGIRSERYRLLVLGIFAIAFAGAHWVWLVARGDDPTFAIGALQGAVLVSVVALILLYRERRRAKPDE